MNKIIVKAGIALIVIIMIIATGLYSGIVRGGNYEYETIVVAVNYNNSGRDLFLGSFKWGYTNFGKPITTSINFSRTVSNRAIQIIKNDYPNYRFK